MGAEPAGWEPGLLAAAFEGNHLIVHAHWIPRIFAMNQKKTPAGSRGIERANENRSRMNERLNKEERIVAEILSPQMNVSDQARAETLNNSLNLQVSSSLMMSGFALTMATSDSSPPA